MQLHFKFPVGTAKHEKLFHGQSPSLVKVDLEKAAPMQEMFVSV